MLPGFSRLDYYVLRKAAVPLLSTVVITAALLLLERMLRLFDFVVNENGPIDIVWQMLAHLVPHYMGMALPVGLFLGTLLAFRTLSLNSELDGMMASGAGLPRLVRPMVFLSLFLALLEFGLLGFVQPHSRYEYRHLDFELRSGALGASVDVGEFVSLSDGLLLRVGGTQSDGQELKDIFLRRGVGSAEEIVATAKRGAFFATNNTQTVLLRLYDGRLIDFDPGKIKPRVLSFESQDIVINLPEIEEFRRRGGEELEMTLPELYWAMQGTMPQTAATNVQPNKGIAPKGAAAQEMGRSSEKKSVQSDAQTMQQRYRATYHWRVINIMILLVIPFLAAPLGLANKRTGGAGGLVAGLSGLIVFNEFLEAGERLVGFDGMSPYLALWGPFALFAGFSGFLFWSSVIRPGRGAAGIIDRGFELILWPVRRVFAAMKRA
ncbi:MULTISPECIES: LptF/LptG family permease [unclassified Iodidimonas]|jgi:lipopolysaccharide export system permease protein|uniref:LptF/LptG family permease n=1 Tax=unclassified Iodidimonas TaxID=2626145 RepID=UPI0024831360|nr:MULTISPECIES: LptF/LptG family permease [unclassified Iodidimonas]